MTLFSLITRPFSGLLNILSLFKKEKEPMTLENREKPEIYLNRDGDIEINIELLDKRFEENVRILHSIEKK